MSVRKHVLASYVGQGWAALMGTIFLPFYARLLGMEAFGLVGVFAILQAWMTLIDLGLTPTLNREMARLRAGGRTSESVRDLLRSLEILYAVIAVLVAITVCLSAPWLTRAWLKPEGLPVQTVVDAIEIMAFVLTTRWVEQIYRGALQGLQDFVWLNGIQVFLSTFRWGGAYLLLLKVATISAFLIWQGIASGLSVAMLVLRTYHILMPSGRRACFSWPVLSEVRGFAGGMFVNALLSFILTQSDKLIVSKLLPLYVLGTYTLASNAAAGLLQLVLPLCSSVYPRFTQLVTVKDTEGLALAYSSSSQWLSAILIPPTLILSLFAHPVMLLWTGNEQIASAVAPLLAILSLGTLFNGLTNLPYYLQLAYGWTSLAIRTNVFLAVLMIPASIWAAVRYGAIGAACGWLALGIGGMLFMVQQMHKRLLPKAKLPWYREAILTPLVVGIGAGAVIRRFATPPVGRAQAAAELACALLGIYLAVAASLPIVRNTIWAQVSHLRRPRSVGR